MAKKSKPAKKPVPMTRKAMKRVKGGGTTTFLKLDGIKGESLDSKHPSSIEISS